MANDPKCKVVKAVVDTRSVFRSAVENDNGDVDAGYLGLYMGGWIILGAIPVSLFMAGLRMVLVEDHSLDLLGVAAIIGAAGTAFGVLAGGIGLFRKGDDSNAVRDSSARPVS